MSNAKLAATLKATAEYAGADSESAQIVQMEVDRRRIVNELAEAVAGEQYEAAAYLDRELEALGGRARFDGTKMVTLPITQLRRRVQKRRSRNGVNRGAGA